MAYRGLGDVQKTEAHLKQWQNTALPLPDALQNELDMTLESGLSYQLRGLRAMDSGDFKAAADVFRRGIELTPGNTAVARSLRHKWGTALFMAGDVRAAVEQFEADGAACSPGFREPAESELQPRRDLIGKRARGPRQSST